jgi:aminodeoxyfutalosine deaminase
MRAIDSEAKAQLIQQLPKADLHLHFEGCLTPAQVVQLAQRHGETLSYENAAERYDTRTFSEFIDLFKWATTYLRAPEDYELLAKSLAEDLPQSAVRYAEITLSVGVMLLRKQDVEANFAAIRKPFDSAAKHCNLRVQWIFDAVRQFGPEKAMEVARLAVQMKSEGVVAFGLGGDEESLPASDFRKAYDFVASEGLHRVIHAGEMGGPESVRDAIEILGAERIGHGIAAIRDENLMDLLVDRQIPLEICPKSNVCTGALAKLLGVKQANLRDHPLPKFVARGVPVTLASDDPALFRTSLDQSYHLAATKMGLSDSQVVAIAEAGFRFAFLSAEKRKQLLGEFRVEAKRLGLL